MKSIQKMESGKYYMIESAASANSVYFETDALAKLFLRYCNYYLKDYLQVEEYILNEHGWAMLIKVKSAKTIRKYYKVVEASRKTKANSNQETPKDIWWILSERVRLFISTYVRMSNKILGRQGSLVRRKYGRYQFDSLDEAKDYISTIRNNKHKLEQPQKKYQGYKEHFRMSRNILTNPLSSSLWVELCTVKEQIQVELLRIFGKEMHVFKGLGSLVAPKIKLDQRTEKPHPPSPPKH